MRMATILVVLPSDFQRQAMSAPYSLPRPFLFGPSGIDQLYMLKGSDTASADGRGVPSKLLERIAKTIPIIARISITSPFRVGGLLGVQI
jgi:hypothetical protein